VNENKRWKGMFTFKEGGDPLDIEGRCGDRTPLLTHFVMIVTDSDQQSFLLSCGTAGRLMAAGRHREEGRGGATELRLADRRPQLYTQPVRPSPLKGKTWNGMRTREPAYRGWGRSSLGPSVG